MNYWLVKSEADCYSIDDLKKDTKTLWTGVRNYQARNFMRDGMKKGDMVLYYHSGGTSPHIAGIAKVSREAIPDPAQFDTASEYFDARATHEKPVWVAPEICFVKKALKPLTLHELKHTKNLIGMLVTMPGQRLSVQPVSQKHFDLCRERMQA